jgi:hypothetical protein
MEERQPGTRDLADAMETRDEEAGRDAIAPADEPMAREQGGTADERGATVDDELGGNEPLLPSNETRGFTQRWQEIQTSFVDEPRTSVERADALVAELMQQLAASFADARQRLERQWDSGDDVSTEDLRVTLTRYRSFFDRLLSA